MAAPSLFDYFRRSVILVIEHTPEGAMGVVLGRASETRVADAVPALAELPGAEDPVHVCGTLGTLDPDGTNESLRRMRVYAGYAGWGPGQLDGELEAEAWIVVDADAGDPFREGDIWSEALRRRGGRYRLLATMPADPSLN